MNNIGTGPLQVASSTCVGTPVPQGGGILSAATPLYDATSMAAEPVAIPVTSSQCIPPPLPRSLPKSPATAPQHDAAPIVAEKVERPVADSNRVIIFFRKQHVSESDIVGVENASQQTGDSTRDHFPPVSHRFSNYECPMSPPNNATAGGTSLTDGGSLDPTPPDEGLRHCSLVPVLDPPSTLRRRSRTAKRNDRRALARFRAKQHRRAEKTATRVRCRQYEHDLALARQLQTDLDSETMSSDSMLGAQQGIGVQRPYVPPRKSERLLQQVRSRNRWKAQKSRLHGRNIKRQLAKLAQDQRKLFLKENAFPPRPPSSSVSGGQLPSACVGIFQWWDPDLKKYLEDELEAWHDDCRQQQAPRQPSSTIILMGIYDLGDRSSPTALSFMSKLPSNQLENSAQSEDLHQLMSLVCAPQRNTVVIPSRPIEDSPAVEMGRPIYPPDTRRRFPLPKLNSGIEEQWPCSRARNLFISWARHTASMKKLRNKMRRLLWKRKFLRLTRHAQMVIGYRNVFRHWWRSMHNHKKYPQRSHSPAPSIPRPARPDIPWVVVSIFHYFLVLFLGGLVIFSCSDNFEPWLSVLTAWVCCSCSLVHYGLLFLIQWLLRGSDCALSSLFGLIYSGEQIRVYCGNLIMFCAYPSSIRHQICASDMQCAWSLSSFTPPILWQLMPSLVVLASILPVERARLPLPPLLWESYARPAIAVSDWGWRPVAGLSSSLCEGLVAHFGFEFHDAGGIHPNDLGLGCQLLVFHWVGYCLLLLLHLWKPGATTIIATARSAGILGVSAELMVGDTADNDAVTEDEVTLAITRDIEDSTTVTKVCATAEWECGASLGNRERGTSQGCIKLNIGSVSQISEVIDGNMALEDRAVTRSRVESIVTARVVTSPKEGVRVGPDFASHLSAENCAVQCVLTDCWGRVILLHGLSGSSSCSDVCEAAGLGQNLWSDHFYLVCNGRRFPPSDELLSGFLVDGRAEFQLMTRLRGANDPEQGSPPTCQPNPTNSVRKGLSISARQTRTSAGIVAVTAQRQNTAGELSHSANNAMVEVGQSLRRSTRSSVREAAPKSLDESLLVRVIYTLGDLPASDKNDLRDMLHSFHRDPSVQLAADQYLRAAHKHLEWVTDTTGVYGVRYRVKRLIPKGTLFGFYSGSITRSALCSNHRLGVGHFGGISCSVYLDGCTIRDATGDAGLLGLVQMVDHSCSPNCEVEPIQTGPGLELFVLRALDDIPVGAEPTFNYDARATKEMKASGISFWRWSPPVGRVASGKRRIQCLCAGKAGLCPNKLWRDERPVKLVPIVREEPVWFSSPAPESPQSCLKSPGTRQSVVSQSLRPSIASEVPHTNSMRHKRQASDTPIRSSPRALLGSENLPGVLSRRPVGVHVLPQFWSEVRRGRLSEILTLLMQSCRLELQNHNAKGIVPRGRAERPTERIEVDLSFLRSLDPSRDSRPVVPRRILDKHVASYRELSAYIDETMTTFRLAVEGIVKTGVSQWSFYAYAAEALPGTPPQSVHQDRGTVPRQQYFTCIVPVSVHAASTEFCLSHTSNNFWTHQDPVLFDGHVWHRGPAVATVTRCVLSLVACTAKADPNHDSAMKYRWNTTGSCARGMLDFITRTPSGTCTATSGGSDRSTVLLEASPTVGTAVVRDQVYDRVVGQGVPSRLPTNRPCADLLLDIESQVNHLRDILGEDGLDITSLESALRDNAVEGELLDQIHSALRQVSYGSSAVEVQEGIISRTLDSCVEAATSGRPTLLGATVSSPSSPMGAPVSVGVSSNWVSPLVVPSDSFSTPLRFELLNENLYVASEACTVNTVPYGRLYGSFRLKWRTVEAVVSLQDDIRASRGEGSCYLLCFLDLAREAESSLTFRNRRRSHPDLQGVFQERWEILLGMADSDDHDALGLRQAICTHLLSKADQFQAEFKRPPVLTPQEWRALQDLAASLRIPTNLDNAVQRCALAFLRPSQHTEEGFMMVLLDWLEHKVAVLNLLQIVVENDSPRFLHSYAADHVGDAAVLMLKVLNIEQYGPAREGLNHFNRVSGKYPIEFLEDLPLLSSSLVVDQRGVEQSLVNSCESLSVGQPATSRTEAIDRLHLFDISTAFGPSQSCTRAERWQRYKRLRGVSVGWEWVGEILGLFPDLAEAIPGRQSLIPGVGDLARKVVPWTSRRQDRCFTTSPVVGVNRAYQPPAGTSLPDLPHSPLRLAPDRLDKVGGGDLLRATNDTHEAQVSPTPGLFPHSEKYLVATKSTISGALPGAMCQCSDAKSREGIPGARKAQSSTRGSFVRPSQKQKSVCGLGVRSTQSGPRQRLLGEFMPGSLPEQRADVPALPASSSVDRVSSACRGAVRDAWSTSWPGLELMLRTNCTANRDPAVGRVDLVGSGLGPPESSEPNTDMRVGVEGEPEAWSDQHRRTERVDGSAAIDKSVVNADVVDVSRPILLQPCAPGATPWIPGTQALYPRPRGVQPSAGWPTSLPIWKVRVQGLKSQEALFRVADNISSTAFYIAADEWTRKDGKKWGVGKRFGAFRNAVEFITNFLEISPTRCFYEIVRKDRPCKAYFDLEAEAGAMTEEAGRAMRDAVLREWKTRVTRRWPEVLGKGPRCFTHMILCGSRMTSGGLKISYHIIFPFLVFPCNTTMLHDEVGLMSEMDQFQYRTSTGHIKSFIDPGVYTSNRQFRLLLCSKLSDCTMTALQLSSPPTVLQFVRSCITQIDDTAYRIPQDNVPRGVQRRSQLRKRHPTATQEALSSTSGTLAPLCSFLYNLLHKHGQPGGILSVAGVSLHETKFRWQVAQDSLRPCMTAQIWRPSQAAHRNNGAWVSVDCQGAVHLLCLHPECLRRGSCNRRLLGQVPISLLHLCPGGGDQAPAGFSSVPALPRHARVDIGGVGVWPSGAPQRARQETQSTVADSVAEVVPDLPSEKVPGRDLDHGRRLEEETNCAGAQGLVAKQPIQLSREQSFVRVVAENQQDEVAPIQAWAVQPGPWGGRLLNTSTVDTPPILSPGEPELTPREWAERSADFPFSVHPPDSLRRSVHDLLASANRHQAQENATVRPVEHVSQGFPVASQCARETEPPSEWRWNHGPTEDWLRGPIISRPQVGRDLVSRALLTIRSGVRANPDLQYTMDTWASPFTVGYLNVGRRHLVGSLQEVAELVLQHRPDILFLGDLVTSRANIGRLKQRLESALNDEWFVTSNIGERSGRPVGIAAVVHCSLAKHMTDCTVLSPEGSALEEWVGATEGRILNIKVSRPESSDAWQFIGIYQHVAKSSNRKDRALLRDTLEGIVTKARQDGHRAIIMGDFNAAPPGGRRGYARWSATQVEDRTMEAWVRGAELTEVLCRGVPVPTWKPCEGPQQAALDRVLASHTDISLMQLAVHWCRPLGVFDHALLILRLQPGLVGTGYAGACRPDRVVPPSVGCQVNLQRWYQCLGTWKRLLCTGLQHMQDESKDNPPDPFEALKRGELLADSIARALAPKYIRRPGEVRRAFAFAGNKQLFRELNLLRQARALVMKVFSEDLALMRCPHRLIRWSVATHQLHLRVCRSGCPVPAPLTDMPRTYFLTKAKGKLLDWLDSAKIAIEVRQAAVRESYDKARYNNLQNLRRKQKEANGVLDAWTIKAALGKCQPRQRMWGISGTVHLGVRILAPREKHTVVLDSLLFWPEIEDAVYLTGNGSSLTIWFSGPRQVGDFIIRWLVSDASVKQHAIHPLLPPGRYVAIRSDDMLAVQEWHMASEGMDTYSVCPQCHAPGLQVLSTSAAWQTFGNRHRAVRFFCGRCQTMHDEPALAPMPPCPLSKAILEKMRKIPAGTPPLINRPIDFETVEKAARKQPRNKAPGVDGHPREFCKFGPSAFLDLHCQAYNAYRGGVSPSVCPHEWQGAIVSSLPKKLSALIVGEFRPVACISTKFSVFLTIIDARLEHATEDYGLIDDSQEGFRRCRSTRRQLCKLHSILAENRRRKEGICVLLFLDLVNAFNSPNHRLVYFIFEANGFPAEDISLFRHMYSGSFLVMVNRFGHSAACFLKRGMPQGAQPSPRGFNLTVNPLHLIVRECQRGCSLLSDMQPAGSSGFADDSVLHTDGIDAIPAMAMMVPLVCSYVAWAGMKVHLGKSGIVAVDMRTGQSVPTDSITLHGKPFPVISPDQPYKHLGVRMTVMGDFSAEKEYVVDDMRKKLAALEEDRVLTRREKEVVIKIAVCSVFCYSAGLVDWTRPELDGISKMWAQAYKRAWELPRCADGSPIIIEQSEGGRGCPSATALWIRAVLDVLEQCVSLPGEISQIVSRYLQAQCIVHGCKTLNQFQLMLRLRGRADSVLAHFLLRLDEEGTEISSPWEAMEEESILECLWPKLHGAWLRKERWVGCKELAPAVQEAWDTAQYCLSAIKLLGCAKPAILALAHLCDSQGRWLHRDELQQRQCHLSLSEYTALMSWLPPSDSRQDRWRVGSLAQRPRELVSLETSSSDRCPPCIRGHVIGASGEDQLTLQHLPIAGLPDVEISCVPDTELVVSLCRSRAVLSLPRNASDTVSVECLVPLRQVMDGCHPNAEYVIVRMLDDDEAPLTVLHIALVRDCLLGSGRENLLEACSRSQWVVSCADYYAGCFFPEDAGMGTVPEWRLQSGGRDGQLVLNGLVRFISKNRRPGIQRPKVVVHPWQVEPPLPSGVTIDTSHHYPRLRLSPEGWEVWQRNGRIWITDQSSQVVRIDAAQYGMLLAMFEGREGEHYPTARFLQLLRESSRRQQGVDLTHGVHWSRHLLANIQRATGTDLLIGASAVTYNPHFRYFASPFRCDVQLGAESQWPLVPALLLLDSFDHSQRPQLLRRAAAHGNAVWVLRRHSQLEDPDLALLKCVRALLVAELPKKSAVLHKECCWEEAAWDVYLSRSATQLWKIEGSSVLQAEQVGPDPASVRLHMEGKGHLQYAFHWHENPVPLPLQYHRQQQQDALRHSWEGLVAGTDGSVDLKTERMGAGYIVGTAPVPLMTLSIRVGGPLSTTRAEAASLLRLVRDVATSSGRQVHLLVFVDCLVVLDILSKWGKHDYHPRPNEVVHFDVIYLLLLELRKWTGKITLVKVKSHSGCLLNERADEYAERGRMEEEPVLCSGPQKYGSFWLRVRPSTRECAEHCGKPLPRDSAPNVSIIKKVVAANILRAVKKRSTVFVNDLFHNSNGATVSRIIQRCEPAVYRVWLRCMLGIYPVQTYLQRIGKTNSPQCLYCADGTPETLTHFACLCPQFREARTSAHNQVRQVITSFLQRSVDPAWKVFEETRMGKLGLRLRPVSAARVAQALNSNVIPSEHDCDLGRWQPDWVIISEVHRRIAIVDLCRSADIHLDQLSVAGARKQSKYSVLAEALGYYSDQGWLVHVFPWVVGIRGLIDPRPIGALLQFLNMPKKLWTIAVEKSVLASIRAFYFLHRTRFGCRQGVVLSVSGNSESDDDGGEGDNMLRVGEKRCPGTSREGEDLAKPNGGISSVGTKRRASACLGSRHRSGGQREPEEPSRRRNGRVTRGYSVKHDPRRGNSSGPGPDGTPMIRGEPRTVERDHGTVANPPGSSRTRKRKRLPSASTTSIYDTDDPAREVSAQPHIVDDEHPATLWLQWRRVVGRKRRSTCGGHASSATSSG